MGEELKIFLTRHLYNIIKLHTLTTNQRGSGLVSAIKTIDKIQGGMFRQAKSARIDQRPVPALLS